MTQAPGANQEAKLGGMSIDGASAGENRYIIDGIETTNLQNGTSGKNLIADFIEEVQVKSSGYTAEFGGATGGVINAVTKSGTNNFSGIGALQLRGQRARKARRRPTLRQNLTNSDIAEYITIRRRYATRIEPGFAIGGPIKRDRLWFFGAYQPAMTTTDRTVNANTVNPDAIASTEHHRDTSPPTCVAAEQHPRCASSSTTARAARPEGLLPALNGTDPVGTNYSKASEFPNYSVSANMDWVASSKLLFGVSGGYYIDGSARLERDRRAPLRLDHHHQHRLAGRARQPAARHDFTSIPTNTKVTQDQQTRALLPGRQHGLRSRRRRAPGQVRRPVRPGRQQRAQRRVAQPRDHPLEHGALHRRARDPRHLRLLLGAQQRASRRSRASSPKATSARRTSASSSRTRGRSTTS